MKSLPYSTEINATFQKCPPTFYHVENKWLKLMNVLKPWQNGNWPQMLQPQQCLAVDLIGHLSSINFVPRLYCWYWIHGTTCSISIYSTHTSLLHCCLNGLRILLLVLVAIVRHLLHLNFLNWQPKFSCHMSCRRYLDTIFLTFICSRMFLFSGFGLGRRPLQFNQLPYTLQKKKVDRPTVRIVRVCVVSLSREKIQQMLPCDLMLNHPSAEGVALDLKWGVAQLIRPSLFIFQLQTHLFYIHS